MLPYLKPERPGGRRSATYWYVRHASVGRIRINDGIEVPVEAGPDDPVFVGRYRAVVDGIRVQQGASSRPSVIPRSLQHLIDVYRSSPEFQQLAASTRVDYEKGLRLLEATFGKMPVGGLAPHFLTRIRDKFARSEPQRPRGAVGSMSRTGRANASSSGPDEAPQKGSLTPRRANKVLTMLSILMSHAVGIGWRKDNPCLQQGKSLKLRLGEWLPWPDEALEQFWQRAPRELVVASFVGVFTGLRGQDMA